MIDEFGKFDTSEKKPDKNFILKHCAVYIPEYIELLTVKIHENDNVNEVKLKENVLKKNE